MKKYVLGETIEASAEEAKAMWAEVVRLEKKEEYRQPKTEERLEAMESALLEMSSVAQATPENPLKRVSLAAPENPLKRVQTMPVFIRWRR